MRDVKIEKLTLNFGSGKDQKKLEKGIILIKHITGKEPIKTITSKRIPAWELRPGLAVGCKLTLRKDVKDLIKRLLASRKNILPKKCFDENGTVSFGIPEYIEIPDVEYEPKIGIMGFEVSVTLARAGFRIKDRRLKNKKVPGKHKVTQADAIKYMEKEFGITVGDKK